MTDETGIVQIEQPIARQSRLVEIGKTIQGEQFVSDIQGRRYPKVEWWTTVGAHAGLTALEKSSGKVTCADHDGTHYGYEATVEVMDTDGVVRSRASMICMSCEVRSKRTGSTWGEAGEYAVKSMALTRATSKAFRINLSYLAVMAGLEATPADEVPEGGFARSGGDEYGICPEHGVAYFKTANMRSPAHKPLTPGGAWCNKPEPENGSAPATDYDELDDYNHVEDTVTEDDKAEWDAAMQDVQNALDDIGLEGKPIERKKAVEKMLGAGTAPAALSAEELWALSNQLRATAGDETEVAG